MPVLLKFLLALFAGVLFPPFGAVLYCFFFRPKRQTVWSVWICAVLLGVVWGTQLLGVLSRQEVAAPVYTDPGTVLSFSERPKLQRAPLPDDQVFYTSSGKVFHCMQDCSYLKNAKDVLSAPLYRVLNEKYRYPCSRCYP